LAVDAEGPAGRLPSCFSRRTRLGRRIVDPGFSKKVVKFLDMSIGGVYNY
jgi:hypothetical protein